MSSALKLQNNPTTVDRLLNYLQQDENAKHPVKLSNEDELQLERINYADDQLRRGYSPKQVRNMLMKRFINPKTEKPISMDTAYRVIRMTQGVHNSTNGMSKDYWKEVVLEMILTAWRKAKDRDDVKNMLYAVTQLNRLLNLTDKESDTIPANLINNIQVNFVSNPEDVGLQTIPLDQLERVHMEMTGKPLPNSLKLPVNGAGH